MAKSKPDKSKKKDDKVALPSGFGDEIRLLEVAQKVVNVAGGIGAVSLVVSLGLGLSGGNTKQFLHSYLVAFMWTLSLGLGALFWVILQNLVNARWSVAIRRVGEILAANMLLLAVMALPIVVPTLMGNDVLYQWANGANAHHSELLQHKAAYLNPTFFGIRFVVFFGFWIALSRFYLKTSLAQDESGKPELAARMRAVSGPAMIGFALTLTFTAFDFLMSLDPGWFSTMFGVYYFAGCVVSANSMLALVLMWLQKQGRLVKSVTTEHYHDLGKMMFAFTVFWAYVTFSQFMLMWYANMPEETAFFKLRFDHGWQWVGWTLVFGNFLIPFFGLLSRWLKRRKATLAFWAVWILAAHWVDMYWNVMPNLHPEGPTIGLLDVTCLLGLGGLFLAGAAVQAKKVLLVPVKDPRLGQSLAFENI
jgi:hypothetical protein